MFHEWKLAQMKKRGERYKKEKKILDTYAAYAPERRKHKISNIVLFVVIAAVIIYTVASFWLTYVSGVSIDPTLTTCVFTFFGSELLALTGIKISKVRKNATTNDDDITCG